MYVRTYVITKNIFKPGTRRPARAWFLEIAFVREVGMRVCVCVCVCVCVSAPEAINNYSREIKL